MTGFPLSKEELNSIKELKRNNNIVISRPDKGNGVVILNREDYVKKMNVILTDSKFEALGDADTNDRTLQQERALQAFLLRACKAGDLPRDIYNRIRPVGTTRPRMYGVPKIHKPEVPLRPILSMVNAPQQELAKWLAEVLRPVVHKYSKHTIRDSFEFCQNIDSFQNAHNTADMFMCSFDITSLFTNIPLEQTLKICLDTLYRDDQIGKPPVPENLMKKLLMKATTDVEFSCNNVMYSQVDGVAMGSPLGPVLANIFVGYCEDQMEEDKWPLFYNRFVDDTFTIFTNEQHSTEFFAAVNKLHPSLRFTMEREENGILPFMDVAVRRTSGGLERSVYRKPTFTGLYTRWDSFSPTNQKISLMRSLTSRAHKICSPSTLHGELAKLREIFLDNGYPGYLVERIIKAPESRKAPSIAMNVPLKPVIVTLPWIGRISSSFSHEIRTAITSGFAAAKPQVVFTTNKAFSGRQKDVLPTTSQSSIVYKFTCRCGRAYVGKTSQRLSERIKQHVPAKILKAKPDLRKSTSDSAITRHLKQSQTCLAPELTDQFKILARARHQRHLDILEALYIRSMSPELCCQKDYVRHLSLVLDS